MTANAAKNVLDFYGAALRRYGAKSEHQGRPSPAHLVWMSEEAQGFEDDGKVMRWLGFVQGVLVAAGMYSIDDVKAHSQIASDGEAVL